MYQMAPLSWTLLSIYFIMIYLMINVVNYFSVQYMKSSTHQTKKSSKNNWKW